VPWTSYAATDRQFGQAEVAMAINELHAFHVRRVKVGFIVSGPDLDPDMVTRSIGKSPTHKARCGEPRRNLAGKLVGTEDEGWWRLDSTPQVDSKDIDDHFEFLLNLVLPHRDTLVGMTATGETYFDVLWESTYLYAGTGPVLSARVCEGIGAFRAGLGFDIYQVDEHDS